MSLPANISFGYGVFDGATMLNALPVKTTPHSQVCDFVVFAQNGASSVLTGIRHKTSGDTVYWACVPDAGVSTPTS